MGWTADQQAKQLILHLGQGPNKNWSYQTRLFLVQCSLAFAELWPHNSLYLFRASWHHFAFHNLCMLSLLSLPAHLSLLCQFFPLNIIYILISSSYSRIYWTELLFNTKFSFVSNFKSCATCDGFRLVIYGVLLQFIIKVYAIFILIMCVLNHVFGYIRMQ